ncbi:hypothetical protein B0I37DRAFT_361812 [Chaetomium sp. MPI-CAGE-AT-0009]|nr:hypothetical protein B0I37DRAFT_361812 [Chaetomium sp. MPI-CAGE-AT-0009]
MARRAARSVVVAFCCARSVLLGQPPRALGRQGDGNPKRQGEPANKRARSSHQWPGFLAGSAFLAPHSPSQ